MSLSRLLLAALCLIAASLLLAPYSAANSVLTVLAVGVIPLFQKRPLIGGLLIVLINLPFLFPPETHFNFSAYYTTALLLVIWGVFGWHVWQRSTQPQTLIQPIPAHGMYNT